MNFSQTYIDDTICIFHYYYYYYYYYFRFKKEIRKEIRLYLRLYASHEQRELMCKKL